MREIVRRMVEYEAEENDEELRDDDDYAAALEELKHRLAREDDDEEDDEEDRLVFNCIVLSIYYSFFCPIIIYIHLVLVLGIGLRRLHLS